MTLDYKKYSLENLENWLNDSLSSAEASPQEIYDVIKGVVNENYHIYKNHTERCYELLALLNGNGRGHIQEYEEFDGDTSQMPWAEQHPYLANDLLTQDRNSNFPGENTVCDSTDTSPECKGAWNSFWEENYYPEEYQSSTVSSVKQDKVVRWRLPVEEVENGDTGEQEYFITFPDDLLEATNLKVGDEIMWDDNLNGSYTLRKVNVPV